jgi:catechol 2,3-dioxygenase-like lactoylglutathione lyase family enzyme
VSTAKPPPLGGVLETSLYFGAAEAEQVEAFYFELLGLREVSRWPGGIAARIGVGLLLLFEREQQAQRSGPVAAHGSIGPGHVCFVVGAPSAYEAWRERVSSAGLEITHEHEWDRGVRSFYFADPAGNLIEIAGGDLWPR